MYLLSYPFTRESNINSIFNLIYRFSKSNWQKIVTLDLGYLLIILSLVLDKPINKYPFLILAWDIWAKTFDCYKNDNRDASMIDSLLVFVIRYVPFLNIIKNKIMDSDFWSNDYS